MDLVQIISISGKTGLFRLVSQLKSGFIIEDISTKAKLSIGNTSQVSLLDNISVYTTDSEVALFDIFKTMAEKYDYGQAISHKSSNEELKAEMEQLVPNYSTERVYVSDMKKIFQWYNMLQNAGIISKEAFDQRNQQVQEAKENPVNTEK